MVFRFLLAGITLLSCAPPRPMSATAGAPTGALAPLAGVTAASCGTFTPAPGDEGLTRGVLLDLEGKGRRRVQAGFDAAGRPRIVTVVAEGPAASTLSAPGGRISEYVELHLDTAGQVRRGRRARFEEGSITPVPLDGLPLTPQDSAAGAALARAVRERCPR